MSSIAPFCMWMILLLPLAASVTIATVGRHLFPRQCHLPCIGAAIRMTSNIQRES